MAIILVQKDEKNLIPINVTTPQRAAYARDFTIYDLNADGSKSAPVGPTNTGGTRPAAAGLQTSPGLTVGVLSADYVLKSTDNGRLFRCTTALTVTVPVGVALPDGCIIDPPATGSLTVAGDGVSTLNGSTASVTRAAANNPAGVAIKSRITANDFGVSGS